MKRLICLLKEIKCLSVNKYIAVSLSLSFLRVETKIVVAAARDLSYVAEHPSVLCGLVCGPVLVSNEGIWLLREEGSF